MSETLEWFALAVIPRKEKVTAKTLRVRGYDEFLPMYSMRRRWSDRMKTVEEPLFSRLCLLQVRCEDAVADPEDTDRDERAGAWFDTAADR